MFSFLRNNEISQKFMILKSCPFRIGKQSFMQWLFFASKNTNVGKLSLKWTNIAQCVNNCIAIQFCSSCFYGRSEHYSRTSDSFRNLKQRTMLLFLVFFSLRFCSLWFWHKSLASCKNSKIDIRLIVFRPLAIAKVFCSLLVITTKTREPAVHSEAFDFCW